MSTQRPLKSLRAISAALAAAKTGTRVAVRFKPIDDEVWRFYAPDDASDALFVIEDADEVSISSAMLGVIVAGRELEMCVAESNIDGSMHRLDNDVVRDACLWITPEHIAALRVLPSPVHVQIDGMMNDLVLEPDGSACIGDNEITPAGLRRMYDAIGGHLGLRTKTKA